jgi:hypothetical protein
VLLLVLVPAGCEINTTGDKPYAVAPILNLASRVHVSNEKPTGAGLAIKHDVSLFDGTGDGPISVWW